MSIKEILNDPLKVLQVTKAAFKALDNDGSGFLERSELAEIMKSSAQVLAIDKPTNEEIDEVLKELDFNKDGKLSQEEFQTLIVQVLNIMAKIESK